MKNEWMDEWMKLFYSRSSSTASVNTDFTAPSLQFPLLSNLFSIPWFIDILNVDVGVWIWEFTFDLLIYKPHKFEFKRVFWAFSLYCWIGHLQAENEGRSSYMI